MPSYGRREGEMDVDRLRAPWEALSQIDWGTYQLLPDWRTLLAYGVGLLLIYLVAKLLIVPARLVLPVIVNGVVGILLLLAFNLVGGYFGLRLAINPVTMLVAGFLGLPGVALLFALQHLLAVA